MNQGRWLERAVDSLDVALLLVNAERKVVYANAAAHRLYGLVPGPTQGLSGAALDRLVVPERRGELRNFEDVLNGGGARRVRSVLRREDGLRIDVTMSLEPCFDDQGQVTGVSVKYYDPPQNSLRPGLSASKPPLGMGVPISSTSPPAWRSSEPAGSSLRPEPSKSESRLAPARAPYEMLRSRLSKVLENLEWLEERLSVPASIAPLDDTRERARTILAVDEARGLVAESLAMLDGEAQIPPAPRIPRM